ncbi:MAG: transcription antitermination factor NusB [Clostridia bacterium]|nr:transcription antitermination factor NusB [Clostridia bacterium]
MSENEKRLTGRRRSREDAFLLVFEKSFFDDSMEDIIERAIEARQIRADEFTVRLASGVYQNLDAIDSRIEEFSIGWKLARLSKVVISILRLSAFEILYCAEDVPAGVSINEAVELAKKYGCAEDPSFINGVLGSLSRKLNVKKEELETV